MEESLFSLISEIHAANYKLEGSLKERVIEALSVRARGARVIHPRFGVGTVVGPLGNYYAKVRFDKHKKENLYYQPSRNVGMHKLLSLDILVQKEIDRRAEEIK